MHKQGECLDTISILNEQVADASLCHVAPYRDEKKEIITRSRAVIILSYSVDNNTQNYQFYQLPIRKKQESLPSWLRSDLSNLNPLFIILVQSGFKGNLFW